MTVELIDLANPPPMASRLPAETLKLAKDLPRQGLDPKTAESLRTFRNAADYIAAAMIFLKDNALLERKLVSDDIRARLLGHWGTCPGLSLVYAHLNLIIRRQGLDMIYVVGPGHGAPAILACLWIENSLQKFYPQRYTRDAEGLRNLITGFSTPGGFPSHINAQTPGSIHEGGELGYALAVAYGAVMDKPDLIACCVVGDGEAETGPTATAWHACKYIDPKESGAVIPILHVNGFKISERTISGCMDNREMACLYSGYGYEPRIVENLDDIDADMHASLTWAVEQIKTIQHAARTGNPITKPRWPMLILRTPKGWGCPKEVHGELLEGSFRSHQVPLPLAKSDPGELASLQNWLASYRPWQLFIDGGAPASIIEAILPIESQRLGVALQNWNHSIPLTLPSWKHFSVDKGTQASCLKTAGSFVDESFCRNKQTLRIFSPDELVSNKLDIVFDHTSRNFQWDIYSMNKGGQVIEMLSEHTLQGFLQGYTMTGRTGIFPSYEAFLPIVHTMMVQYSKFMKVAHETPWRQDLNSLNYIETSTWTRQEHNGFSHQNPCFIGAVLNLKAAIGRVYLPPDANTFLSTLDHCLRSKNYVNLIVGSKAPQPVWLTAAEADAHCKAGASIWKFASTNDGIDPDVVLVGIGAELMFEVIAAAAYLRQIAPMLAVRVVNVTDLMILGRDRSHPHSLTNEKFDEIFTSDRPIHFNYHGYANELQGLLFGRRNLDRITINSYDEEGSTTTPFDMVIRNRCSRYHVAEMAVRAVAKANSNLGLDVMSLITRIHSDLLEVQDFIMERAEDPPEMYDTPVFKKQSTRDMNGTTGTERMNGINQMNGKTAEHTGMFDAGECFSRNGNM